MLTLIVVCAVVLGVLAYFYPSVRLWLAHKASDVSRDVADAASDLEKKVDGQISGTKDKQ